MAEPGHVQSEASRSAGPPGPGCHAAAAGWPGETLVWEDQELVPGYAGALSSGHPGTPPATSRLAAASGQNPTLSDQLPTREL